MHASFENLEVVLEVIAAFSELGIPYALGGSWASSLLGEMRFTHDADFSVEPFAGREGDFCQRFGPDYYLSLPAIQEAIRHRSTFNIIHTPTSFKVDVFIRKRRPFDEQAMQRRRAFHLPEAPQVPIMLVTPEDIVLFKLEWYRLGNETSEQQWRDVQGVMKIQAAGLDHAYLDHWAAELKVTDLLARARAELAELAAR